MKAFKIGLLLAIFIFHWPVAGKVIDERNTLYQKIYITEQLDQRCMSFKSQLKGALYQSCMDLRSPSKLVFDYYKGIATTILATDTRPNNILVIGLGGGVIPMYLAEQFPMATIESVEIDPVVVEIANKYFNYTNTKQLKTHIGDARVFIKRAYIKRQTYDLIILDAFGGDYIPEHLLTKEFLSEVKRVLKIDGIVISNTFNHSALYDHESETYAKVFGGFYEIDIPSDETNRIIFTSKQWLSSKPNLTWPKIDYNQYSSRYGFNPKQYFDNINQNPEWKKGVKLLTDQYSPSNLFLSR